MTDTICVADKPVPFIMTMRDGACVENTGGNWSVWQLDLLSDCCEGGMIAPDVPRNVGIAIVWIFILGYIFMGVALGAEVFMTAIEVVTAKELKKETVTPEGTKQIYHVKVWNATVANLTLMALGSSAPEILLNVVEVLQLNFNSGALGPSTIVGSAAFNLMVITAVCVTCLPAGEKRTLKQLGVFLTTAFYSVLAYIWLFIMVIVWTPEVITVAEGLITCFLLALLILHAYIVDKRATAAAQRKYVGVEKTGAGVHAKGVPSKAEAAAAIKAAHLGTDASPDAIKEVLEEELLPAKSRLHYRKQAMKGVNSVQVVSNKVSPSDSEGAAEPHRAKVGAPAEPGSGVAMDPTAPGMLTWQSHTYDVNESGGAVTVSVIRVGGSKGAVSCMYATKNQKAIAGKDYEETSGELTWADGDTAAKSFDIKIFDDDEFEKDEEFTVVLADPKGGASFPRDTDGGEENEVCTVTILNDDDRATRLVEAIRMLRLDADQLNLAGDDWIGSIKEAVIPPEGASTSDLIIHVLMVPWKLMFALCPPAGLCGGYPCFFISLALIGFQVILISDFANQVGCQMYIKTSVTAITFVALGTSLPDTFASMAAARGDKWADNSVGNVTGSNSVNVFFGLGVPWLIGALYWAGAGANDDWHARYGPGSIFALPTELYNEYKGTGAFIVRSGDLGLSVVVFTICAIVTIFIILIRRQFGQQELGGNKAGAIATGLFLVFLWLVYIIISILATYGKLSPGC